MLESQPEGREHRLAGADRQDRRRRRRRCSIERREPTRQGRRGHARRSITAATCALIAHRELGQGAAQRRPRAAAARPRGRRAAAHADRRDSGCAAISPTSTSTSGSRCMPRRRQARRRRHGRRSASLDAQRRRPRGGRARRVRSRCCTTSRSSARRAATTGACASPAARSTGTATLARRRRRHCPTAASMARLTRFVGARARTSCTPVRSADRHRREQGEANTWPELDIAADAFISKRARRRQARAPRAARRRRTGASSKLSLANDAGRIDANGWWRVGARRSRRPSSTCSSTAEDAGAFLDALRLSDGGHAARRPRSTGSSMWAGAPQRLRLSVARRERSRSTSGAGQFTKIDPGIGKLLGVLSLQALPRRITLDFRDVFSEGFAFDDDRRRRRGSRRA